MATMEVTYVPDPNRADGRVAFDINVIGHGSPQGVQTATPGAGYVDLDSGNFWVKQTGEGNTGWAQVGVLPAESSIGGTVALGNNVENGTVTGLALTSTPSAVALTVQSPSGGQVLWAELVGAPTTDGFAWQLNGITDLTTYKLHYLIIL